MDERDRRNDQDHRKHAAPDRSSKENDTDSSPHRNEEDKSAPAMTPRERQERWPVG